MCRIIDDIWSLDEQYSTWLEVEVAVATVQGIHDIIPAETAIQLRKIRWDSSFTEAAVKLEETLHHDVAAFVDVISTELAYGEHRKSSMFVHYGMTASDIVDTAFSLRLKRCAEHLLELTNFHAAYPWPESAILLERAIREISIGMISGPVGTHASTSPKVEDDVCKLLGLRVEPITTQIIGRDHHAAYALGLTGVALAHGGRSTGAVLVALENIPVWHERDIAHSSAERVIFPQLCEDVDAILHGEVGA